jgi:hypothetical protein
MLQSSWSRTKLLNPELVGRKIVEWTLNPSARPDPNDFNEFKNQLSGGLDIVDRNVTKFQLVETPGDTIVIRLPPPDLILQARNQYTPSFDITKYPFYDYLNIDPQGLGITAEQLFYSSIGSYTTAECE